MSCERHVLLIADQSGSAADLRQLLARAGYRVTAVARVEAGLAALVSAQPDLVLLDVSPPAGRALDPLRALSDVPVLVLAAEAGELEKVCALKGGLVLSPERLLELVWAASFGGAEEVRTYVFYLRRKLRPADPIETVRGFGYRYRA